MRAGVGKHSPNSGKRKAGQQGEGNAHPQEKKKQQRRPRVDGDVLGGEKDAGADDSARQKQDGVSQRQSANQFAFVGQCAGTVFRDAELSNLVSAAASSQRRTRSESYQPCVIPGAKCAPSPVRKFGGQIENIFQDRTYSFFD